MHSARSPNWRSRSIDRDALARRRRARRRGSTCVTVLPVPPFGPSTQIIGARPRLAGRGRAARRRATTFWSVNRTRSGDSGRRTTSSAPISKSRLRKPSGDDCERTTIGRLGMLARRARRSARARAPSSRSRRSRAGRSRVSCSVAQLSSTPRRKPTIWIAGSCGSAARTAASSMPSSSETSVLIG